MSRRWATTAPLDSSCAGRLYPTEKAASSRRTPKLTPSFRQAANSSGRPAPGGADLPLLAAAIAAANLPLLAGAPARALMFLPGRVVEGEWWRVLSYPFVHVSLYHLALDAGGFLLLYAGLKSLGAARRLWFAAASAAGSLAAAFCSPALAAHGLCGLSGAAHGLMAVTGLEMMGAAGDRTTRRMGALALALVAGKSVIEAATGSVFFVDWHFGDVGAPLALCHLGGVLGGAAAWGIWKSNWICAAIASSLAVNRRCIIAPRRECRTTMKCM